MVESEIRFEYDPAKNEANRTKHGIDFEEAQALWRDDHRIEFIVSSNGEIRHLVIAFLGGKCWTAVITKRHETIRIISVRRARTSERNAYEEKKKTHFQ
jgi:uncharacterized DUF497 family protein